MIPKVIHYCWFGGNPIPSEYQEYIESWRKYCPGFEIKQWNETNFDFSTIPYMLEAYEAKKWAFVSDVARLEIIYRYGGIYLDIDVEVLRDLTPLICNGNGFIGFQNNSVVNTGLGFAASAGNICIKSMLDVYKKRRFLLDDGAFNLLPCPAANTFALFDYGLQVGKEYSLQIQFLSGITVYPESYFNPLNGDTGQLNITKDTYTIHHYGASWFSSASKYRKKLKHLIPNSILKKRADRISERHIEILKQEIRDIGVGNNE